MSNSCFTTTCCTASCTLQTGRMGTSRSQQDRPAARPGRLQPLQPPSSCRRAQHNGVPSTGTAADCSKVRSFAGSAITTKGCRLHDASVYTAPWIYIAQGARYVQSGRHTWPGRGPKRHVWCGGAQHQLSRCVSACAGPSSYPSPPPPGSSSASGACDLSNPDVSQTFSISASESEQILEGSYIGVSGLGCSSVASLPAGISAWDCP